MVDGRAVRKSRISREMVEKNAKARTLSADTLSNLILLLSCLGQSLKEDWFIKQSCRYFYLKMQAALHYSPDVQLVVSSSELFDSEKSIELKRRMIGALGLPASLHCLDDLLRSADETEKAYLSCLLCQGGAPASALASAQYVIKCRLNLPALAPLLESGQAIVYKGFVYADAKKSFTTLVCAAFRAAIVTQLTAMAERKYMLDDFVKRTPLAPLYQMLRKTPFDEDTSAGGKASSGGMLQGLPRLTPSALSAAVHTHFPLCQKVLSYQVNRTGHLKNQARLQLWTFLKDAGLTCDEQIALFKAVWRDKPNFIKEHTYTMRHLYGYEGKRVPRKSKDCFGIVNNDNPNGELHLCPFKHFNSGQLGEALAPYNLQTFKLQEILRLQKNNEPQIACRVFFDATHPEADSTEVGLTPLGFYAASLSQAQHKKPAPNTQADTV